jgi:hypothetical protein
MKIKSHGALLFDKLIVLLYQQKLCLVHNIVIYFFLIQPH